MIVRLLEDAQILNPEQVEQLMDVIVREPTVPVEELLLREGYVSARELDSLRLAVNLLMKADGSMPVYDRKLVSAEFGHLLREGTELCTAKAIISLRFARQESGRMVCAENLLLGLMRNTTSIAAKTLKRLKVNEVEARKIVVRLHADHPPTQELESILSTAMLEADNLEHDYIGAEHLLLAILHDAKVVDVLEQLGVSPRLARKDMLRLLGCGDRE